MGLYELTYSLYPSFSLPYRLEFQNIQSTDRRWIKAKTVPHMINLYYIGMHARFRLNRRQDTHKRKIKQGKIMPRRFSWPEFDGSKIIAFFEVDIKKKLSGCNNHTRLTILPISVKKMLNT